MFVHQRQGSLEVICGPMFSGKSEELIQKLNELREEQRKLREQVEKNPSRPWTTATMSPPSRVTANASTRPYR